MPRYVQLPRTLAKSYHVSIGTTIHKAIELHRWRNPMPMFGLRVAQPQRLVIYPFPRRYWSNAGMVDMIWQLTRKSSQV